MRTEIKLSDDPPVNLVVEDVGTASIIAEQTIYGNVLQYVRVPTKHRPAVALALLGGLTDELTDRVARMLYEMFDGYYDRWHYTDADAQEEAREHAKRLLEAIFG